MLSRGDAFGLAGNSDPRNWVPRETAGLSRSRAGTWQVMLPHPTNSPLNAARIVNPGVNAGVNPLLTHPGFPGRGFFPEGLGAGDAPKANRTFGKGYPLSQQLGIAVASKQNAEPLPAFPAPNSLRIEVKLCWRNLSIRC